MNAQLGRSESSFEDRFTGCLLGMAIGDALGVPRAHRESNRSRTLEYESRVSEDGTVEVPAGQFSLNLELALCLLETLATSDGFVDPELAAYRFENATSRDLYLSNRREVDAIARMAEAEAYQSGGESPASDYAGPAARVVPVALAHALSDLNIALFTREVMRSVLLTESNPVVVNGALAVAHAVRLAVRQEVPLEMLVSEVLCLIDEDGVARALRAGGPPTVTDDVASVVSRSVHAYVLGAGDFARSLEIAFSAGGATHLTGAITGALCGAHLGAGSIDQDLIDGLEGRAYMLMAAPTLLRTAQLRAGLVFQLRLR